MSSHPPTDIPNPLSVEDGLASGILDGFCLGHETELWFLDNDTLFTFLLWAAQEADMGWAVPATPSHAFPMAAYFHAPLLNAWDPAPYAWRIAEDRVLVDDAPSDTASLF